MHDAEAEQGLIGAVLLHNEIFGAFGEKLTSADFFEGIHAEIWDILGKLIVAGKRADPRSIAAFLPADLKIGEMPIKKYLARLAAEGAIPNHAPQLADMIRDLSDRRAMAGVASELGKAQGGDPSELAAWAIEQLDGIVAARTVTGTPSLTMQESVARTVDTMAKAYQNDGKLTGMAYGLHDLDRKTSGLQRGELTILAGRPGMLKTGLALNWTRALCQAGYRGIFFSLEMGDQALTRRMLSDLIFDEYDLPYFRMKSGRFTEKDFERVRDASMRLKDLPLRIEQQSGLTIAQIGLRARQMKRKGGLDFIVVDHMGHVAASERYRGNKVNETGEISGGLLRLCRELDIGLIALSQLTRGVEARDDKRPNLSDLRNSGDIEQDAAVVMMVYRESYYLQNREPKPGTPEYELWQNKIAACIDRLDIIIEKQRDGSTGLVKTFVSAGCNAVRDENWKREMISVPDPELTF